VSNQNRDWKREAELYKGMRPVENVDEAASVIRGLAPIVAHAVMDKDLERAEFYFGVLFDAAERLKGFLKLSTLRAAQPLTREGIDVILDNLFEPEGDDGDYKPEIRAAARMGAEWLRDALLDSLADKEAT
jgi:hypothetical protein